jgi:hypothetical protein
LRARPNPYCARQQALEVTVPGKIHPHDYLKCPKIGVTYTLVLAEIVAVLCFFIALGKESDQDLVNIKKAIIAFDVNDRILPKDNLPAS